MDVSYPEKGLITDGKGEVYFHGIPDHYFDRSGKISLDNLYRMLVIGGTKVLGSEQFDIFRVTDNNPIFPVYMVSTNIKINQEQHMSITRDGVNDFKMTFELIDSGKASISCLSYLIHQTTNQVLCEMIAKIVIFNKQIGRALALPVWFIEKYGQKGVEWSNRIKVINIPEIPENAHKTSIKVKPSDLDYNNHTEAARYVVFFMDCASSGVNERCFESFDQDIAEYSVNSILSLNIGESNMNDELAAYIWQDKSSYLVLHFVVSKEGKPIYYASALFNETPESSVCFHEGLLSDETCTSRL